MRFSLAPWVWVLLAPSLALAQLSILPASPQMLDPVRVAIPRMGPFVFDSRGVRVELVDGKFTVHMRLGAALDPTPPPGTFEVLLGQLPMGTYSVEVVLDGGIPPSLGTTTFTVGPRTTVLPTYSDLWWKADESGWGLNVVQHPSDTIFATLFVYDPAGSGAPRWYVMPAGTRAGNSAVYTGALYRTTGPQLAGSFGPSAVTRTPVGTMTLAFPSQATAGLTVSIDGRTTTKTLERQPF